MARVVADLGSPSGCDDVAHTAAIEARAIADLDGAVNARLEA